MPNNPSVTMTTTLASMADQLRLYTKLQQFFAMGGVTAEPMAGIANRVMQKLFTRRMPWRFNQSEYAPFPYSSGNFMVSQPGFQQIQFAGASVFVLMPQNNNGVSPNAPVGGCGIDLASIKLQNITYPPVNGGTDSVSIDPLTGIVSVQTIDPHPYQTTNVVGTHAHLTGLTNPAFNCTYVYNNTLSTAHWDGGLEFISIEGLYNFNLQGVEGEQYGSITGVYTSGSTTTVAVTNTMSKGDVMTFSNVATNAALNGLTVTLLSATATTVTFTTPVGVTITSGTDSGFIYAAPSGAPGIFNASWLQSADMYDLNSRSFPMPVEPVKAVHRKSKEYSTTGDVLEIALQKDANNGVLTFRLSEPMGSYTWGFGMTIQKRAYKMSKPSDVFPWPDELSYVLFEMCLAEACRVAYGFSAAETQVQMQAAMNALMSALESEDREDNTESMTPDWSLMSGGGWR